MTQYESEAQDSGQEKSDTGSDKYTVYENPMNENLKDTDLSDGPFDIIAQLLEKEKNKWKDRWGKLIVRENEVQDLCKKKFMEIDDRMREIEFSRNFVGERAKELELRQKELDDGVRELELKKMAVKDDEVAAAMRAKIEEQKLKEMWERMDYKEKELERAQALCEERFKEIEDKVQEVESSRKFVQERAKELELKQKELHDGFKELESKKMEFTEKTNKSVGVDCSNAGSSDDDLLVEYMHRSKSSAGGKHKMTSDKTPQKKRKKMFETENKEDVKRYKQVGMKDTTVKNIIGVRKTWKGFDDWLLMRYQPKLLTDVVQNLSEQQKNWVTETGLESLLSFGMKEYPRALGYYLVLSFEKESCSMVLGDNRIPITEDDVSEVLGLPKGAKSIEIVNDRETKQRWQSQYPTAMEAGKVTANMVYEALKGTAEVDRNFKLNFLILMSNILIQAPTNPYVRQSLLNFTGDIDKCNEYNWCEYVIECLKLAMDAWLDKPKSRYYTGSLPFLVYFYLDRVVAAKRQVRRSIPTFIGWKDSMISDRQLSEVSNGTIGHGRIAKSIRDKGSDDEESSFEVEGDSTNDEVSNAGFDTFNNANEQQQS